MFPTTLNIPSEITSLSSITAAPFSVTVTTDSDSGQMTEIIKQGKKTGSWSLPSNIKIHHAAEMTASFCNPCSQNNCIFLLTHAAVVTASFFQPLQPKWLHLSANPCSWSDYSFLRTPAAAVTASFCQPLQLKWLQGGALILANCCTGNDAERKIRHLVHSPCQLHHRQYIKRCECIHFSLSCFSVLTFCVIW